jgi:hypothetical protein
MPESAEAVSHAITSYAFALGFRLGSKLCTELISGTVLSSSPNLFLRCGGMDILRTLPGRDVVVVSTDTSSFLSSSAIAFSIEAFQPDDRLFVGDADFPVLDTRISGLR